MKMKLCSVCGKPTITGGLCEWHGKAYYDFYEEKKYQEEDKDDSII